MFTYTNKYTREVMMEKPDARDYLLMEEILNGTRDELNWAMRLLFDSWHIQDSKMKQRFRCIAARELSNMEALAEMMQLARGNDANYVDAIDLENPGFEVVQQSSVYASMQKQETTSDHFDIACDMAAMLMENIDYDRKRKQLYEFLKENVHDERLKGFLDWLIAGKEENMREWDGMLHDMHTPIKHKTFGLGYLSENAWEPDSGNYFDKPNPYFINPDDLDPDDHKKEN